VITFKRILALTDEQGIIIKAIHYDWIGQSIKNVYPDLSLPLFHKTLLNKQPQIHFLSDKNLIQAYYPIQQQLLPAELRPLAYGVLVLSYDMSFALKQIQYDSIINSLLFWLISIAITFFFIAILNRLITHPISYLSRLMHQFALTEQPVTARLQGKGELQQLAQAFNHLVKRLTESKNHLLQQKNLYQTLSDTNQLIVRVNDKQKLLEEACQIIVNHGGFPFVWASFCNDNTFVTAAGNNTFRQKFSDTPPSDVDLRHWLPSNQTPVIINNIQASRQDIPYLVKLDLSSETKSYACFPLCQFNQIVGQIAIYSHQPHYFTDEIVNLFQGLSQDISFALEKIKLDQLRKKNGTSIKRAGKESRGNLKLNRRRRDCYR